MDKKKYFLIQFICLSVLLLVIMLQGFTHAVELKPLNGFVNEEQPVELTFKTYYDGTYQNYLTEHAKRETGFREFFIRNYNQVCYSFFDKITNGNIVKGYDDELFLKMYLDEATGVRLKKEYGDVETAKAAAMKNVEETLAFIDTLRQHGTEFLFVFAPSKPAIYPEKMPRRYQNEMSDFSLEEYYIELFKEKGIAHIDFLNYFKAIKDTVSYPLYTKFGTHWAESTMPFVTDSVMRKIASVSGFDLPRIQCTDLNVTTDYLKMDNELNEQINLLFPIPKPALPRPILTLQDTIGKDRPTLLVIGDSYYNQLSFSCFKTAFKNCDYLQYNKTIYSTRKSYYGKPLSTIYDAAQILEEADVVMAFFTAPMMYNYMFGFIESAYHYYKDGCMDDEQAIQSIIERIKDNPQWLEAVKQQAQKNGISLEENLRVNAKYVYDNQKKEKEASN